VDPNNNQQQLWETQQQQQVARRFSGEKNNTQIEIVERKGKKNCCTLLWILIPSALSVEFSFSMALRERERGREWKMSIKSPPPDHVY